MATKGKDNIIDGQIAFDFLAEIEVVKPEKKKRVKVEEKKPVQPPRIVRYKKPKKEKVVKVKPKKKFRSIKPNHLKKARKVKRIPGKFLKK